MKIAIETTGTPPSDDSRDESPAESTTRWRRVSDLLEVWGVLSKCG